MWNLLFEIKPGFGGLGPYPHIPKDVFYGRAPVMAFTKQIKLATES